MIPKSWLTTTSESVSFASDGFHHTRGRQCKVPGCPNHNCNLATHRKYVAPRNVAQPKKLRRGDAASTALNEFATTDDKLEVPRDGVDGMPALPISHQSDPQLKTLFHHFFDHVFEPLAQTFRGPSVGSMSEYKNRMLATALTSESYCMGLIVQSQTDVNIKTNASEETRDSLDIYTTAVTAFRKQVSYIQQARHPLQIELALLVLCTLISYDTLHHRTSSIMMHWKGLQQLVEQRGGLHCVTISLAYVVHVDRMCAQRFNQQPAYTSPTVHMLPLPKPQGLKYGSNLLALRNDNHGSFDRHIIDHCIDTCGLVELWELSQGRSQSNPSERRFFQMPSTEYQHFTRDRLDEQFTLLHAAAWEKAGKNECLLWASRIVEYPVTWWNQIPTVNTHICGHLVTALQKQNLATVWEGNSNMLLWLFFVLTTIDSPFRGRGWAISCLQTMISTKLGSQQWPADWWVEELENVQRFVWCNTQLTSRFRHVCMEVEASIRGEGLKPVFT